MYRLILKIKTPMLSRITTLLTLVLALHLIASAQGACSVQRCCYASPCSNTYCQQKNSQTWISSENFANYGYTKLVLSAGSCLPCSYDCQSCSGESVCSKCGQGYYMSNSSCIICGYKCSSCVVINSISKCSVCSDGTYLDSSTASCKNCATGAATCASATVVSACKSGYYLTSNSMFCLPCPSNCQSCPSSASTCSACNTGYYLNTSACYPCTLANCYLCSLFGSVQYCLACTSSNYVSGGNCYPCSSNCFRCSSSSSCVTCNAGYYLISGGCLPATTTTLNCNTYSDASTCSSCLTGYYYNGGKCWPCSLLCTACYGLHFGACTSCATGSSLFNQMCLPQNYLSQTSQQFYLSFPAAAPKVVSGSPDCYHYLYSGTTVTLNLNDLAASRVSLRWKLFSVGGSTSYSMRWVNSAGTLSYDFTTSSAVGQAYPLCGSTLYYAGRGEKSVSVVRQSNQLSFSTNNGVSLGVLQVVLEVGMCNSLCLQCSETACWKCLTSNLYTQDASCVYTCSSGYYIYINASSPTGQNTCLQRCPTGSYALSTNLSCVSCSAPCLSCLNQKYCLSCIADYYLSPENTCLQVCPYRYFGEVLTQTCQKCVGRCNECIDQQKCLNCKQGFYYAANYSCLDSCDPSTGLTGRYADLSTLKCEPCDVSCLNCLLASTYCTSCPTGKVIFNNTCLNTCPLGYYPNNMSQCLACGYPCEGCAGSASTCTACIDGYLFNSTCVTDCATGYYEDHVALTCGSCGTGCQECIVSASSCSSCLGGYFLFNSSCVSSCPAQFYGNTTTKMCQSCVGNCYTCLNDTFCLACSANFLLAGQCVSVFSCPSGSYADISTLSCLPCNANCLTCEYSATACKSCSLNSSVPLLDGSTCVSACSSNTTYADPSSHLCAACLAPCFTCTSSSSCTSCIDGYMLSGSICSTSCGAAYYYSTVASGCEACLPGCSSCASASFCQVCQQDYYIKAVNATSNECVSSCGSQLYVSVISSSCRACLYPCLQCSSASECLSCQEGALYQSRCLSACPDTTFKDNNGTICSPCTANCLTCSSTSSHCLTCQPSYFLVSQSNSCTSACPAGTYAQNVTQMCLQCPSTCSLCLNSTYCTGCIANRTYLYSQTGICLSDCPLGYFANTATTNCETCNAKCLTCSASSSNCLSCSSGYYLVRLSVNSYDCVATCPAGYYQEGSNCQNCLFPCATCASAAACLTCVTGTYYYSSSKGCLLACPSDAFLDAPNAACTPCTAPCASCRSSTYCLSCTKGLYLTNGQCLSACPSGYYPDTTLLCNQCSGLCKTCSSKYYCLTCLTGYMSNGYCYSSCPAGTYADINASACITCLSPCLECAYSTTYCTRCISGMVQYQGKCSSDCPAGTYLSDGACVGCSFPCVNCTGAQLCSECLGGYLLYNGVTCINDTTYCPNDLYKMDGKYCIPKLQCPSSYYTDNDLKTCSSACPSAKYRYVLNQSCLYSCPVGYYVGLDMTCMNYTAVPPSSLMGMTVISFVSSNIIHMVVSFNQTATFLTGATDIYTITATTTSRLLAASGINYNMESSNPTELMLKVGTVPTEVDFRLPAQYVVSSTSRYPLQTPNTTVEMPSFVTYDYGTIYQGLKASQFGYGLGWFILLLSVFYLFKNRISHLYTLWDTVQLLYVVILLEIQYPPALNEFLRGLSNTLFLSFPNIFTQGTARTVSARPFYAYTYDNNFLRNAGPSLTLGIIVILVYLVFKGAAELNRRVERVRDCLLNYPKLKRFMFETLLRFRWHYVSDVIFLTYLSVFLFAMAELYNMGSNPGRYFSNLCCVVSLIVYLIFPIFAGIKLHRHFPNIRRGKHSQNLRCFYRGIDKTSQFGVFLIMIRYFRKVVYAVVIGVFSSRPMYALPILMFTSVLMALFIFLNLPFKKRLSNIVQIINEGCIALLFLGLALVNFNNQQNYTNFNVGLGYACTGLLIFILLLLVFEVFCRSLFKLKSEEEIKKENELKLEEMSQSELRRRAGEFFDFIFPRIKKELGFGEDSDDESYKYEEGDSQNSENNLRREQEWGINDEEEPHSEEFRHYDASEASEATEPKQKAPEYLIRCVKELQ